MYITKSFIDNPYLSPDISCLNWLTPLDWKMTSNISKQVSMEWFNTTNAWGDNEKMTSNISKSTSSDSLNTTNAWGEIEEVDPITTQNKDDDIDPTKEVDNAYDISVIFVLFFSFVIIFIFV